MRRPSGRVRRGKLAEMDRCKFTALLSILIVLLPCASVGGTVDYECVIILNGTCTELLPDWDVGKRFFEEPLRLSVALILVNNIA